MNAEELLQDGNRLFRDELYWAALLRYEQAAEAGLDTPLLHYNTGVTHYRAGQHARARESLQRATKSPWLRQLAHYNLGLNAYAAGDVDNALRWFRYARDQGASEEIAGLAGTAIGRIERGRRAEDPVYQRAVLEREELARRPSPISTLRTPTCRLSCRRSGPAATCRTRSAQST
jgi:tetratricopeptide (TPR) repeat protein